MYILDILSAYISPGGIRPTDTLPARSVQFEASFTDTSVSVCCIVTCSPWGTERGILPTLVNIYNRMLTSTCIVIPFHKSAISMRESQ